MLKNNFARKVNFNFELNFSLIALCIIAIGFSKSCFKMSHLAAEYIQNGNHIKFISLIGFLFFSFFLAYGGAIHCLARYGYLKRVRHHRPISKETCQAFFVEHAPALTIL